MKLTKRMGKRALAMVGVTAALLLVGGSAQARDWNRGEIDWDQVRARLALYRQLLETHKHTSICVHRKGEEPVRSVPEPSAALVFGIGLLVARGVAKRNR